MMWLVLIGLFLGLVGTVIILRGELKTSAAQIRHFWGELEDTWYKKPPSIFKKFSCLIAKKLGSKNVLDLNESTVENFSRNFWGFVLLFLGFLLQIIGILIELDVFRCR